MVVWTGLRGGRGVALEALVPGASAMTVQCLPDNTQRKPTPARIQYPGTSTPAPRLSTRVSSADGVRCLSCDQCVPLGRPQSHRSLGAVQYAPSDIRLRRT